MRNCILVIEHDPGVSHFMQLKLEEDDFTCLVDNTGESAVDLAGQKQVDLIVLDADKPLQNGDEIIDKVREISFLPIIYLSSDNTVDSKVRILNAGADDYITKPYATKELIARIRAALRRHDEPKIVVDPSFTIGDLSIFPERHEVRAGDEVIDLTKKEFDLLLFLSKNKNRVLKREEILEKVWGYGYAGETNIVDVYVRYLRSKIDEKVGKKYIHTVRGIGYVARD